MNCTDCKEKLAELLEDLLPETQRQIVEEHLKDCQQCRAELQELKELGERLTSDSQTWQQTDLEDVVFNRIIRKQNEKLKQADRVNRQFRIWRQIMNSRITKLAAAAMAITVAGIFILTASRPSYAIAQTVDALSEAQNLRMTITNNSQLAEMLMLINPQTGIADHIRMDKQDTGDVIITIPGQSYIYSKDKNEVTLLGQELLTNDLNFKDVINSLIKQTNASNGHLKITKTFNKLAQQKVVVVTIIRQDESIAGEFLIDPYSKLPIYIGIEAQEGQLSYMGPIEYNINIPEDAFEFTIPKGAKVIDNRSDELKSQSS
ncbi:MAG: zf-HC2 domain-containing protein [Planctomycetota bacterium]|jgi:hypothetical protein